MSRPTFCWTEMVCLRRPAHARHQSPADSGARSAPPPRAGSGVAAPESVISRSSLSSYCVAYSPWACEIATVEMSTVPWLCVCARVCVEEPVWVYEGPAMGTEVSPVRAPSVTAMPIIRPVLRPSACWTDSTAWRASSSSTPWPRPPKPSRVADTGTSWARNRTWRWPTQVSAHCAPQRPMRAGTEAPVPPLISLPMARITRPETSRRSCSRSWVVSPSGASCSSNRFSAAAVLSGLTGQPPNAPRNQGNGDHERRL